MKKVLVVSGHPDLKSSLVNATILAEFEKNLSGVEIRKLDELYPDYKFDVAAEQKALENADVIIFQYPFHWYDVPGILKLYIDKIMLHSWAYGSKGNALKDKIFIASTTVGAGEENYSDGGAFNHKVEDFVYNLKQFAALCKMDFKKFFYMCGSMYVPGVSSDEDKNNLLEKSKTQAKNIIDFVKGL